MYYQNYCEVIGMDLSKQRNINIPSQSWWYHIVFIAEKQQNEILIFFELINSEKTI